MDQQVAVLLSQTGSHEDQMTSVRYLAETIPQLEARIAALPALSEKLADVEGRVVAASSRTSRAASRRSSRDVAERFADVEGRLEGAVRQHRELEATFDEKTQLGRREAEDIRSQIAPLLEERVRRHESDALLFAEMERLRESLAESLHDLAERLRQPSVNGAPLPRRHPGGARDPRVPSPGERGSPVDGMTSGLLPSSRVRNRSSFLQSGCTRTVSSR